MPVPTVRKDANYSMRPISGCVCGVVNAYYRVILEKTDDGMRHMLPVLVTSIVEINIAIIVGCMPAFKHFVQTHIVAKKSSLHFFFSFSSYLRSRLSTTTRRSRNTPSGDFRKFSGHVDSKSNLKESENDNDNDNGNSISNLNDRLGEERRGGGGGGRRGEGKGEGEIVSFEMHAASPVWALFEATCETDNGSWYMMMMSLNGDNMKERTNMYYHLLLLTTFPFLSQPAA